jgi:choline dehydrogenase
MDCVIELLGCLRFDPCYSGVGGPVHITNDYQANHCTNVWINAAIDSGIEFNADYNASQQDGVSKAQVMLQNGTRVRYVLDRQR